MKKYYYMCKIQKLYQMSYRYYPAGDKLLPQAIKKVPELGKKIGTDCYKSGIHSTVPHDNEIFPKNVKKQPSTESVITTITQPKESVKFNTDFTESSNHQSHTKIAALKNHCDLNSKELPLPFKASIRTQIHANALNDSINFLQNGIVVPFSPQIPSSNTDFVLNTQEESLPIPYPQTSHVFSDNRNHIHVAMIQDLRHRNLMDNNEECLNGKGNSLLAKKEIQFKKVIEVPQFIQTTDNLFSVGILNITDVNNTLGYTGIHYTYHLYL